jgi:gliding motility-associated protein GldL
MSGKKESKLEYFFRVVAPKITSVGAAVVVVGALFKIMHWPGAGEMLTVGLLVEAGLFFMGVVQPAAPPDAHYHWERVYPILDEGISDEELPHHSAEEAIKLQKAQNSHVPQVAQNSGAGMAGLAGLDKILSDSGLNAEAFKNFGKGVQSLNTTASQMKDLGTTVTANNEYAKSLQDATKSLATLNKSYADTTVAMSGMASASSDAKAYHEQLQNITKNLGALNAVYEMELKDANSHLKAMNKFYGNLTVAMESMSDASKESQLFKEQMVKLTTNITSLNKIYGNMLTAMKG